MFKLLLITSLLWPVVLLSAAEDTDKAPKLEEYNEYSRLDHQLESIGECENTNLYILFSGQYVEMHAMDHLSSAILASEDCKVENITVSYPEKNPEQFVISLDEERASELQLIFNAYYGAQHLEFDKTLNLKGSEISDDPIVRVKFEFENNSESKET